MASGLRTTNGLYGTFRIPLDIGLRPENLNGPAIKKM